MNRNVSLCSAAAIAALALLLSGCPQTGVVCQPGTDRCGDGCADFTADRRNCGGCGIACQSGQICRNSACECAEGSTLCGGKCVNIATDPENCGKCGQACGAEQVCETSAAGDAGCQASCTPGLTTQCGNSCVRTLTDNANCGGCGVVCQDGRVCKQGSCSYDVVVACYSFGEVRGVRVSDAGVFTGPLKALGTTPGALAVYGDKLLVADDTDRKLIQASLASFDEVTAADGGSTRISTGTTPAHLHVNGSLVLVTNSGDNTLQVVQVSDAGTALSLATVSQVPFGGSSSPQSSVVMGSTAYVPLFGGGPFTGGSPDAGQTVVRVNVTNPASAAEVDRLNLTSLVQNADGGVAHPRPFMATSFDGKVYVSLNNLDDGYQPAGEGTLAEVNPADGGVTAVKLGASRCLNAAYFAQSGDTFYVSCSGKPTYNSSFEFQGVVSTSVLALKKNGAGALDVVAEWVPSCPQQTDAGTCVAYGVGRIAVVGSYLFVADQASGRVWVLSRANNQLTEVPALTSSLAATCPPPSGSVSYSSVYDMVVIP